jgi:hypothetical protein
MLALVILALAAPQAAAPPAVAAVPEAGPCAPITTCEARLGYEALRLQTAWDVGSATERAKIREAIAAHTAAGKTDWNKASDQYFEWWGTRHAEKMYAEPNWGEPDWGAMRRAAEASVRARLIDPESARFEWPKGFAFGYWKPFLSKRITGYYTCGLVNSRNRMGGYVGATAFAVVVDEGQVKFTDIGTGRNYDFTSSACAKTMTNLPVPQPGMLDAAPSATAAGPSIADEIAKLAQLRDRGVLTQQEFDEQKAALLRRR